MALENEPPGHNRLERMGLPGYGRNPGSPKDVRPRQKDIFPPIQDSGISLDAPGFGYRSNDHLGIPQNEAPQKQPASQESSRTVYALIAAGAIAIGSLLANYVQWQKLTKAEENQQLHLGELQDAFLRYDDLHEEYLQERTARRSAELTTRLHEADIFRMRQEIERVRELYYSKLRETQRPLPQNGNRVSDNTNNSRGISQGE